MIRNWFDIQTFLHYGTNMVGIFEQFARSLFIHALRRDLRAISLTNATIFIKLIQLATWYQIQLS